MNNNSQIEEKIKKNKEELIEEFQKSRVEFREVAKSEGDVLHN